MTEVLTPARGRAVMEKAERHLFERIPGYAVLRGLTQQLTSGGRKDEASWKPALVEIEEALVPAFVIEELPDGRYTVFVPSVPTPMAGAVYCLDRNRVHLVAVGFPQAVRTISRWGSGMGELVAAMEKTDIGRRLGDDLAVELQHEPQNAVRSWMRRSHVEHHLLTDIVLPRLAQRRVGRGHPRNRVR